MPYAITSPHYLATDAGASVLADGGSAIEAMVATAAAIAVAYPHMNSLGGDGFWLISPAGRKPIAIDATGCAAAEASIDGYRAQGFDNIPERGGLSALTTAGAVAGWQAALDLLPSHRPLADLLAPALDLARGGIPVSHSLAAASNKVWTDLSNEAGYKTIYAPEGRPLNAGETLINQPLADTLDHLAVSGLADFYQGDIGQTLARSLELAGSPLRRRDLQHYKVRQPQALTTQTRDGDLFNFPAPTQGLASLMILALFDRVRDQAKSEADRVHLLIECTKLAFRARDRLVCDPDHVTADYHRQLDDTHLDALATQIRLNRAQPWPHPAEPGDTVWFGCVDADGTMVSYIQSLYWEFGSGVVCPQTGIAWTNRGLSFKLDDNHPNRLRPGARPFTTLNPAYASLGNGDRIAYGTMGGEGQPQTQAALMMRHLVEGQSLQDSIAAGRWLLGRTWGDTSNNLKLEADLANRIAADLQARGHDLVSVPEHSEMMGHAGAIRRTADGRLEAATDPRSDGRAVVQN
ncbi:gamma-glutamyltransferase family protein [Saccharospirillum mangrovi]|uniref:gamma-glutamyltransferase family protein n=1 Tax=Saccharospirillum mangrovi TaxID=2161747 RepID=UPI000D365936|nr:gamma-glutamyltransferase [Saccharospirillum mangrovi]